MSDISPINQPSHAALGRVAAKRAAQAQTQATPQLSNRQADSVEISVQSNLMAKLREMPDVRVDLVAEVKAEIARGDYITDDKLDVTVDAMLGDLL